MADDKVLGIVYRARGASQVVASSRQVESSINSLHGRAVAFASSLKTGVGNALGTFGGRLRQAAGGVATLAGVGGLLGLGGVLASSISKVEGFGAALEKVQLLTGESAVKAGALILQFQKFGMTADDVARIVGFTEKTLGKLSETHGKGAKAVSKLTLLDKQYGLRLVDSKGKVADFSTTLSELAKFYDSNASASTKAYVAAQIFGRGYTAMMPILAEGSAGLRQAAADAAALGLGGTDATKQLLAFHDQMHSLDNQINVLQLSIGMALLPTLIDLSKAATTFVQSHRADIVTMFKNVVAFGRTAAGTIAALAGKVSDFWNSIPQGVRDLLLKGLIADRTINFLFGISPIKLVASLATGAISGLLGGVGRSVGVALAGAGLGKLFVQPVFVTNPGFGTGGGVPGAVAGAAEGAAGGAAGAGATGLEATVASTFGFGFANLVAMAAAPLIMMDVLPFLFRQKGPVATVQGSQGMDVNLGGSDSFSQGILAGNPNFGNLAAQAKLPVTYGPVGRPIPVNVLELPPGARHDIQAGQQELARLQTATRAGDAKLDSTMQAVHTAVLDQERAQQAKLAAANARLGEIARKSFVAKLENVGAIILGINRTAAETSLMRSAFIAKENRHQSLALTVHTTTNVSVTEIIRAQAARAVVGTTRVTSGAFVGKTVPI